MSYRVEVAKTGRAGCQQTECKKQGVKIDKGSLRFGTWVETQDYASWRWKHWGCVTGKQLENVRAYLDPSGSGKYQWDMLDGYDDEDKGSLHDRPDLQEKVRRVVTQGHIDSEDWRGDPEMNKLGEIGVFTSETKKKIRNEEKARKAEFEGLPPPPSTDAENPKNKKPVSKKRARAKEESDDEEAFEERKPAPKKRASKVKKEELDADEQPVEAKPKAKRGRKSVAKKEIADEQNGIEASEAKPKAKRGAKKALKEEAVDEANSAGDAPEVKPKSERGRKAVVKREVVDEQNGVEAPEPKPKAATKRGRKKAVKKEEPEPESSSGENVKGEPGEASSSLSHITPATFEDKVVDEDPVTAAEQLEAEEDQPKKKSGRVKSGLSARSKRSRTSSKN